MIRDRRQYSGIGTFIGRAAVVAALLIALICPAYAFFPFGAFDADGVLRLRAWPFNAFDNNGDSRVVTDDDLQVSEGLETLIEGGRSGFTVEEIELVKQALRIWASVPTSYASFRLVAIMEEPVPVGEAQGEDLDTLSVIAMQVDDTMVTSESVVADPPEVVVAFPGGVLGVNVYTFTIEDLVFVIDGENVDVAGGTILDSDIIINGGAFREDINGVPATQDLLGVLVHEVGHHLGLGHTPLNNLDELGFVENAVFWDQDPNGVTQTVGITPTMFPIVFDVIDGVGDTYAGQSDLAPDEISGISWLYERDGASAKFFSMEETARTIRRDPTPFPSQSIAGGHLVAWADTDNNPDTPRVPMFSTMTGFYETLNDITTNGNFQLFNLWKQFLVPGSEEIQFNPTYSFTLSPLNERGADRQSPAGYPPDVVDVLHDAIGVGSYNTIFPSQTFHEDGNIFDMSNRDAGTPLMWTFEGGRIVSADTDRTFPNLLGPNTPMFGDPLKEGLFNCAVGGSVGEEGSKTGDIALMLITGLFLMARRKRGLMRTRAKVITMLAIAVACLVPISAEATIANLSDAELTAMTSDIVAGTVDAVETFRDTRGRVVTEIIIGVQDIAKGRLNKGSNVAVYVSGGTIDGLKTVVTEMPTFKLGEEVLLFLGEIPDFGLSVNAGFRGKVNVMIDKDSKKKYVAPHDPRVKRAIKAATKSDAAGNAEEGAAKEETEGRSASEAMSGLVTLEQYLEYLRGLVRAEKRAQK